MIIHRLKYLQKIVKIENIFIRIKNYIITIFNNSTIEQEKCSDNYLKSCTKDKEDFSRKIFYAENISAVECAADKSMMESYLATTQALFTTSFHPNLYLFLRKAIRGYMWREARHNNRYSQRKCTLNSQSNIHNK